VFSGREKPRKKQFDFERLRASRLESILPQILFFDHGEHLQTVCILGVPVTSGINWALSYRSQVDVE
jgi:hypothetical protein